MINRKPCRPPRLQEPANYILCSSHSIYIPSVTQFLCCVCATLLPALVGKNMSQCLRMLVQFCVCTVLCLNPSFFHWAKSPKFSIARHWGCTVLALDWLFFSETEAALCNCFYRQTLRVIGCQSPTRARLAHKRCRLTTSPHRCKWMVKKKA